MTGSERPDERAVRGALRALTAEEPPTRAETVVHRAVDALDDVERAAAFVADGGEHRLERAVAETTDAAVAGRGRRVLTELAAFRMAARGGEDHETTRRPE